MDEEELERAVEAAILLGAEQATTVTEPSGYHHRFPDWLYDGLDDVPREDHAFGYVEGVLVQRGPPSGGCRLAAEADRAEPSRFPRSAFVGGLRNIYPAVLRARVRRILLEGA